MNKTSWFLSDGAIKVGVILMTMMVDGDHFTEMGSMREMGKFT